MQLYLFEEMLNDIVLKALLSLKEGNKTTAGYKTLVEFVAEDAFTDKTVAEYTLRLLLKSPISYDIKTASRYIRQDVKTLYQEFFSFDYNGKALAVEMLPLPVLAQDKPLAADSFASIISTMVKAKDANALGEMIEAFYSEYHSLDEALYSGFLWRDKKLVGIKNVDTIKFSDLEGLEYQKKVVIENTAAFVKGKPANNVLLVGGSGTGKSSCVKAALNHFKADELKLVELSRTSLQQLPELMDELSDRRKKYIIFIDDLSFDGEAESFLLLKTALEGQVAQKADNILIYATSNRRHLIKESWNDRDLDEDIHQNDTLHEKVSLSERFGIRLYFSVISKEEYFRMIAANLAVYGITFSGEMEIEAEGWAIENNGRSGRSANQFARHIIARWDVID